jgi:hypothetical protein
MLLSMLLVVGAGTCRCRMVQAAAYHLPLELVNLREHRGLHQDTVAETQNIRTPQVSP